MKVDDLYFGIAMLDWNTDEIVYRNLFDLADVKECVATWARLGDKERLGLAPLGFCFGGVQSRAEYEMVVHDLGNTRREHKTDIYKMFVIPNQAYLLRLVFNITPREGKRWLKTHGYTTKLRSFKRR